jgi:GT2 family glycosyltransferase
MIKYYIDTPSKEEIEVEKDFEISGWALSKNKIKCINIYINDVFYREKKDFYNRLDVVSAFPEYKDFIECGFSIDVDIKFLEWEKNKLKIEIIDFSDNIESVYRYVTRTKSGVEYHNYYISTVERRFKELDKYLFNDILIEIYVDCTDSNGLDLTLKSLENQTYRNLNFKLFTLSNNIDEIKEKITSDEFQNLFIEKLYISHNTGYVGFLKAGEILEYNSIKRFVKELERKSILLCYSDNDKYLKNGIHIEPNFKPDFSYNYLLSRNYIGGFYLVNKTHQFLNLINNKFNINNFEWRFELLLDILFESKDLNIKHIHEILWSSVVEESKTSNEKSINIIRNYLEKEKLNYDMITEKNSAISIKWPLDNTKKVSIIIPTIGKIDLLKPCVNSILDLTSYKNFELIFLDNGRGNNPDGIEFLKNKNIKVVEVNEVFNWSRLNNIGAMHSTGELYLFLNDDIEVLEKNWLDELVRQALRPSVGAVGGLLLYPDKRIQHAGVFLVDHGGGARHWLHFANLEKDIYQNLHQTVREVTANTGACLMMRKEVFDEVGGFDEKLPIVGNDIDICLRILNKEYLNIWTPECILIHHESISRKKIQFNDDEKEMWKRWGKNFLAGDSFYNKNLSLENSKCELVNLSSIEKSEIDDLKNTGINLIGYIKAEMGVGEGARGVAKILHTANIPFCIINYEKGNPSRMGDNTWQNYIVDEPQFDINILHINADLTPSVVSDLPEDYFKNKYTIGFWAWELPDFPDEWIPSFSCVNEVWVPSNFVKDAVEKKSNVPVHVMSHPIEKINKPYLNRNYFNLPEKKFLFLMMYDIHSIQERKNPKGSIKAFKNAFRKENDDVGLIIKVNNSNENELNQLKAEIGDYNNIYIIDKAMSRYEVDSLITCCDAFISLHRSEGFGLVLAESMALGKPVISTNWSGNIDFMNNDNSICIDYELKLLGKDYGPYKSYQKWAEPNIEHASIMMQKLVEDGEFYNKIAKNSKEYVLENLSPFNIAKVMKKRILEIMEN